MFFTDDFMFCKIMKNNEHICKSIIEILLGIQVERIDCMNKRESIAILKVYGLMQL